MLKISQNALIKLNYVDFEEPIEKIVFIARGEIANNLEIFPS